MTDIVLMSQLNQQMKAEGITNNPQELSRRYNLARRGQPTTPPPTPPELLNDIFGGPVLLWQKVIALMHEADTLEQEIIELQRQLEILEQADRCNGWTHENKSGSLYIHHASGAVCPLHGRYIKDRGRVYIGRKPEKQEAALRAITMQNVYQITTETFRDYSNRLIAIDKQLNV